MHVSDFWIIFRGMADKPTNDPKPVPVTARDVRIFAAKLRQIADTYDGAAELLDSTQSKCIEIAGKISAERGLKLVRGWSRTVSDAVDDLLIETRTGPAIQAAEIAAEARRKGKGK